MYPSDKRPRLYTSGAAKKREKKRRLDNAVAGTSKIRSFFVTTTEGEDETSEGNPENSKRDAVDVAPSVPAPEDAAAAEPTPTEPATAEPTTAKPATKEPTSAEPARCGPVVRELDLTLDKFNPTDRALFQLGRTENRERQLFITVHAAQKDRLLSAATMATDAFSRTKTLPCTFWGNGNRTAMALLLANDEEAIICNKSNMLVVR